MQQADPKELFRKRVRRLRKAAKLSLEEAAERGGLDYNYWGEIERGNSEPGLEYVFRIAKGPLPDFRWWVSLKSGASAQT